MTNYNLEEFKAWLAADPNRQENLPNWSSHLGHWGADERGFKQFIKAAEGNLPADVQWNFSNHRPYHQVFLKFKAEVDNTLER